jgi:two-component system chemotaxis response regulator CheB
LLKPKIRVIVVDDSALVRSLLAEIINRQHDMECIGSANDPLIAREMIRDLNPDVITLDVEMPRMDGIDFLGRLMRLRPMPVVMISTLTERGAEVTMRALELGAIDFVAKPRVGVANGLQELASQIVDKIRVAAVAQVHRLPVVPHGVAAAASAGAKPAPRAPAAPSLLGRISTEKIIAIGASTGGPEAIREVLTHAGRLPGHRHHPAHAAGLHHQFCGAPTACAR